MRYWQKYPHKIGGRGNGFTLIETLVVCAVITLLAGIVTPVVVVSRQKARNAICGTTLHGWGRAIQLFSAENNYIPASSCGGKVNAFLAHPDAHKTGYTGPGGGISVDVIAPYIGGVIKPSSDHRQWRVTGLWLCPGVSQQNQQITPHWFWPGAWILSHMHYNYFAGTSYWNEKNLQKATDPDDFTDRDLTSDRLLMADFIMNRASAGWLYNHGSSGHHGVWSSDDGAHWADDPDDITGINHLYGDGHVRWIDDGELQVSEMETNPEQLRHVGETHY